MKTFEIPSEKFLEDILFDLLENGTPKEWIDSGLSFILKYNENKPFKTEVYRQANLDAYGIADVLFIMYYQVPRESGITETMSVCFLFELKRGGLSCVDINQILRYYDFINSSEVYNEVIPILIGNGVGDCHYILNYLSDQLFFLEYSYSRNGFLFKNIPPEWMPTGHFSSDTIQNKYNLIDDKKEFFSMEKHNANSQKA